TPRSDARATTPYRFISPSLVVRTCARGVSATAAKFSSGRRQPLVRILRSPIDRAERSRRPFVLGPLLQLRLPYGLPGADRPAALRPLRQRRREAVGGRLASGPPQARHEPLD